MSDYPEHDKLKAIPEPVRQAVGDFIGWLSEQDVVLCEADEWDQFMPINRSRESLMAEFFEIDRDRLEAEKRAMLDKLRGAPDEH